MSEDADDQVKAYGSVVAIAWSDAEYKQRLLTEPAAVLGEAGVTWDGDHVRVVENTAEVVHFVVPTDGTEHPASPIATRAAAEPDFKHELLERPREVLEGVGVTLPDDAHVVIIESAQGETVFVLPAVPDDDREEVMAFAMQYGAAVPPRFGAATTGICDMGMWFIPNLEQQQKIQQSWQQGLK
jgi:hypothetical protein